MSSVVRVCALGDVPEQGAIGVEIGDVPVAVVRVGGEVFALHDVCSHEEVPLSEGDVYDHTVECWLHGSCFDLRSGAPTGPPATKPVPTYPVKVEDGDVYVLEEFRGKELGVWLMECVMSHPDLQGLRRFSLATRDAHGLYKKFGFAQLKKPESQMEIVRHAILGRIHSHR